jgi:hypothetical protein
MWSGSADLIKSNVNECGSAFLKPDPQIFMRTTDSHRIRTADALCAGAGPLCLSVSRGGRKVRLIDLPIPIRSSDCIGRYNRLMPSSDFCIGRLYRFVLSSNSLIVRSCFLVLSSDFCIGRLCRFVLSSDSLIVQSCFFGFKFRFLYRAVVSASFK